MKKIVVGLIIALSSIATHAKVLCIVDPTSSVYKVDTYVRMQESCKTTTPYFKGGSAAKAFGATAAFIGIVAGGIKLHYFLEGIKEENKYLIYEITWADGNKDLIKVRSEEGDFKEATAKIRSKFANSATPIQSLAWVSHGKPEVEMIIE